MRPRGSSARATPGWRSSSGSGLVYTVNRENVLGGSDSDLQNARDSSLPNELMSNRTSCCGTQLPVAAAQL